MTDNRFTVMHVIPELKPGGAETQLINLARWQLDRGLDVHFSCNGGTLVGELLSAGAEYHPLPIRNKSPLNFMLSHGWVRSLVREVEPDIVQAYSRVPAWHFYLAARGTEGTHFVSRCGKPYAPHPLSRVMAWGDRVVTNSGFLREHMTAKLGADPGKTEVIANGVEPLFFEQDPELRGEIRGELGLGEDDLLAGMVGRFTYNKRWDDFVETALRVLPRHTDLHLVLVGDGPRREPVEDKINYAGMPDRFHLVGFQQDVHPWLNAMDTFLFTGERESCPNALIEAMAAGLPVIATEVGGVPGFIEHGENGLLAPAGDISELADRLDEILGDAGLRERLAENARETAREEFSLERMGRDYLRLYNSLTQIPKPLLQENTEAKRATGVA